MLRLQYVTRSGNDAQAGNALKCLGADADSAPCTAEARSFGAANAERISAPEQANDDAVGALVVSLWKESLSVG